MAHPDDRLLDPELWDLPRRLTFEEAILEVADERLHPPFRAVGEEPRDD